MQSIISTVAINKLEPFSCRAFQNRDTPKSSILISFSMKQTVHVGVTSIYGTSQADRIEGSTQVQAVWTKRGAGSTGLGGFGSFSWLQHKNVNGLEGLVIYMRFV